MAEARKPASFVHLRVKSAYSLLEGAIRPAELADLARANAMPAVAVTDVNNLFGVFEITETLAKAGVQPIVGALLSVELGETQATPGLVRQHRPPALALLVQNEAGYRNLAKLLSAAYLGAEPGDWPHVKAALLAAHAEGLIALTGGPGGPLNRLIEEGQPGAAAALLDRLKAMFGDRLYVELQRHGLPAERAAEEAIVELAYAKDLPLVATNDVHFGKAEMYEAHDALLCIADATFVSLEDRRRLTREHRFKSAAEMAAQFADLPEAIENTLEIARRCAFRPKKRDPILPKFEPESGLPPAEELRRQAEAGLTRRLKEHGLFADEKVYRDRLVFELDVIIRMDFPGYFLIVSDFMKWTRNAGIPVGVRGSGATSLVAWALDITNLDPIRFGLLFERFLNPERISMPDFDIDFCQERRDEVVRYVQHKYGEDRVAHIIALGSLQARAAVRDVGRVLQMPLGLVDRIAKLIPNPPGKSISLAEAIQSEPRLQTIAEQEPIAERLFGIVRQDRRALSPRLDPSRRRRHRRSSARRDRAALSRSALGDAGHPIRLRRRGKIGPRQIRLSRPQDADRDRQGGRTAQEARHRARHPDHRFRRRGDLRHAGARRQRRRVPAGRRGNARSDAQDEARPYQRSGGAGGALPSGADGFDSRNTSPASAARKSPNISIPRWSRSSTKPSA